MSVPTDRDQTALGDDRAPARGAPPGPAAGDGDTTPSAGGGRAAAEPGVTDLLDLVVARLGGSPRAGQQEMADAVAAALRTRRHLLVQAGTGTGKSLGYLVPAVAHAVATDERVMVSTATLALQRQIIGRDLPLVAETLAEVLDRPVEVAVLKGWHNYLCLHRFHGAYPEDDGPTLFDADAPVSALGGQVQRARAWAEQTDTGDRDDLVPGVSDRAWRQLSVTSLECLGSRCPHLAECFPERARTRAREADVVVTNHAMLGIAASGSPGVLPEHTTLIVDEAHELVDRVTAQATVELSGASIEHAARLGRRHGPVPTEDLDRARQALTDVLAAVPPGRLDGGLPPAVATAVGAVRDAARGALSALKDLGDVQGNPGRKLAQAALLVLFEIAERMADPERSAGEAPLDVLWCAPGPDLIGPGPTSRLHAAPLAVAGLIRSHLLAERSVVLTSATLTVGGSFDPPARSVGLAVQGRGEDRAGAGGRGGVGDRDEATARGEADARGGADGNSEDSAPSAAADRWRGIDVGSPFDYARQGILYIARRLPQPTRDAGPAPQMVQEVVDLVTAAGGRTLGLFSSRRAAEAMTAAVREVLPFEVLCQGDDQLPTLVRRFVETESTCLFGTLSLWQGIDAPGRTCSLVLIDRLPFPRPDDPVRSARSRVVDAAGGNGFMAVSATHAALLLAQGSGRLIRSTSDRGVVAVLDPRLATARYGEFLLRSLPPFWRTTDGEVARAALRRLAEAAEGSGATAVPAGSISAEDGPADNDTAPAT